MCKIIRIFKHLHVQGGQLFELFSEKCMCMYDQEWVCMYDQECVCMYDQECMCMYDQECMCVCMTKSVSTQGKHFLGAC